MTRETSRSLGFFWNPQRADTQNAKRRATDLFPANDSFSETVNFRFESEGVIYRGLISHATLRAHFDADHSEDGPMNAFIRHAGKIAVLALSRLRTAQAGVVRIESDDLSIDDQRAASATIRL